MKTQADRGRFYKHFSLGLLELPNCVGWPWFRLLENAPAALPNDPFNRDSNGAIPTICNEPYPEIYDAIRALRRRVHRLLKHVDHR